MHTAKQAASTSLFPMDAEFAIQVENLSKCYQIYDKPHQRLLQMLYRGHRQYYREFWALSNVSLTVKRGETVGIIGRNGSGKSTLLQLICGTLHPTSGSIQKQGRVAALLELGAGFNPEFTGRENVYMNASILGLKHEEIDDRFNDIANFAEIGDFIDQPVKTFSSGMYVRLAFAVAINVAPEILVVDEALSVGDELFQRKCFSRIEAIREAGATILFVSHSGSQIIELCDRAILLDGGEKLNEGEPKRIVGQYQRMLYAPQESRESIRQQIRCDEDEPSESSSTKDTKKNIVKKETREFFDPNLQSKSLIEYEQRGAVITNPRLFTLDDKHVNNLVSGNRYKYCYRVDFLKSVERVRFGMLIKTVSGVDIGGAGSSPYITYISKGSSCDVQIFFDANLNPGTYFMNAGIEGIVDGEFGFIHRVLDVVIFRIIYEKNSTSTSIVNFNCELYNTFN